jgi:hypothetical protein
VLPDAGDSNLMATCGNEHDEGLSDEETNDTLRSTMPIKGAKPLVDKSPKKKTENPH